VGSILLVEADPETRGLWAAALSVDGHDVIATSTRDALRIINDGGIDVVVIDAYDPRMGVVDLARGLEALPDAPPIVLVSSSPHAPEISVRIGAAAFVAKPCEPSEVAGITRRLMGHLRPVRVVDTTDEDPTGPNRIAQ
jgi:DNA-binding response OmpR family regulator